MIIQSVRIWIDASLLRTPAEIYRETSLKFLVADRDQSIDIQILEGQSTDIQILEGLHWIIFVASLGWLVVCKSEQVFASLQN